MKDLVEVVFCGACQKEVKLVLVPTGQIVGEFMLCNMSGRFADDEFAMKIRGLYEKYIRQYI
ncbi:MAG: hypothetical protein ACI4FZ_11850 [Lachnospiraceae bacterium]